jgi:hypothetical protein
MRDIPDSPDTVIQHLLKKYRDLQEAFAQLTAHIKEYSTRRPEPVAATGALVSLQEHYNMLDQDDCSCPICMDWVQRREEFIRAGKSIPAGHKWSICSCNDCRFVGRFQLNLLAAANRRELLIEMSFHARFHSRHGELVMAWTVGELAQPLYTDNWCAQEMNRFPMERWLQRCENAVSGAASGKVFVNSTMKTDLYTPFNSSLTADVDASCWLG